MCHGLFIPLQGIHLQKEAIPSYMVNINYMFEYLITCFDASPNWVEAPKTNHLRDPTPNLEKYKVVQMFIVYKDRNNEDCKIWVISFLQLTILWSLKSKVGMNILPMSIVCHNNSFLLTLPRKTKTLVTTLLVSARFNPNLIDIQSLPCRHSSTL
jgi:hypothetical protein